MDGLRLKRGLLRIHPRIEIDQAVAVHSLRAVAMSDDLSVLHVAVSERLRGHHLPRQRQHCRWQPLFVFGAIEQNQIRSLIRLDILVLRFPERRIFRARHGEKHLDLIARDPLGEILKRIVHHRDALLRVRWLLNVQR